MWKPGQPDNWGHGHDISGEDCAGLIHEALWNDFVCEDLISYICEKELEQCEWFIFIVLHTSWKWGPHFVPLISCSETSGFIAKSRGGSSGEQLDVLCVAPVHWHGADRVSTGSKTGQFLPWSRGCCSWCVSRFERKPSSSNCSAIQQDNLRRTSGFNWIISETFFFVFHVQLNIWMCISLRKFVRNYKFYESRIYRTMFYAEIILKRCTMMGNLATVAVEEDSLSVYVTSSFRSSNNFHIYKSTGDFIHVDILPIVWGSILSSFRFNIHDYLDRMCLFLHSGTVSCYKKWNTLGITAGNK